MIYPVALTAQTHRTTTLTATSVSTYYAACATNNLLGPEFATPSGSGMYVEQLAAHDPHASYINDVSVDNAYDCCVACFSNEYLDNCQAAQYLGSQTCTLVGGDAAYCPNGKQGLAYSITTSTTYSNVVVSNGPCGYVGDAST